MRLRRSTPLNPPLARGEVGGGRCSVQLITIGSAYGGSVAPMPCPPYGGSRLVGHVHPTAARDWWAVPTLRLGVVAVFDGVAEAGGLLEAFLFNGGAQGVFGHHQRILRRLGAELLHEGT